MTTVYFACNKLDRYVSNLANVKESAWRDFCLENFGLLYVECNFVTYKMNIVNEKKYLSFCLMYE